MSRPTKADFEELVNRCQQLEEITAQALEERNRAVEHMRQYQTCALALAGALKEKQSNA